MNFITSPGDSQKSPKDSETTDTSPSEQWMRDLRQKRNLQVTGKPKPPQNRNLERLKQILTSEGFKIRGNRLLVEREEATFEVDLKMGHVNALNEGKEPIALCVTLETTPWASLDDLTDFDLFLLSIIYMLKQEELPASIIEQL